MLLHRAGVLNAANHFVSDAQFPTYDGAVGKIWLLKFRDQRSSNCHFLLQSAYNEKK
jgi:hypothetical protein